METIKDLQKQFAKMQNYLDAICEIWDNQEYKTLSVLLQNISFRDDLKITDLKKYEKAIETLKDYCGQHNHVVNFVYENVAMDITAFLMKNETT